MNLCNIINQQMIDHVLNNFGICCQFLKCCLKILKFMSIETIYTNEEFFKEFSKPCFVRSASILIRDTVFPF